MVFEYQVEHPSQWAAIYSIAAKFGISHETLRNWFRRAEVDDGLRPGLTSDERQRLKQLEREVRDVRRLNETSSPPRRSSPGSPPNGRPSRPASVADGAGHPGSSGLNARLGLSVM
jgi:transposase